MLRSKYAHPFMQMVNLAFLKQNGVVKNKYCKKVKYLQSISKEYDNEMLSGILFSVVYLISAVEHYLCVFSIRAHWLNGWVEL